MIGLTPRRPPSAGPILYTYLVWSLLLCVPMFATGLDGFDFQPHRRLALHFDQLLRDGIWYPRWLPDVNHGYGNPTFIFYNPLYYYVVSLCRLLVPGIEGAMFLAAFLGLLASGATMYRFARLHMGHRAAAWAGLAYILLPYHAMNLYSRSALPEFWAMTWLPLILAQARRLRDGHRPALAWLALTYAALIYTHLCTAFLFSLFLIPYVLFLCRQDGRWRWRPLLAIGVGMTLGLGLGAPFLLPAVLEQRYVQIELARLLPWGDPLDNFLFYRPVWGIGFSLEVSIGAVLTLVALVISYRLLQRRPHAGEPDASARFFVGAGLVTLLLMTPLSWPLWRYLPFLPTVQFPWRLMTLTTLCAAFAIAAACERWAAGEVELAAEVRRRLQRATLVLVLAPSLAWLALAWWEYTPRAPWPRLLTVADVHRHMDADELARLAPVIFSDRSWDILEFRPVWAPLALARIAPPAEWGSGTGMLRVETWAPLHRRLATAGPGVVKLRTFYFPGWIARLDGQEAPAWPDAVDGRLSVAVPRGTHTLTFDFEDTPVRALSWVVAGAALAAVLLLALAPRRRR